MLTVIADSSALTSAAKNQLLDLLPDHFERIILPPAVVDELVENEVIDALVAGAVERIIEVVSVTQQDELLARALQAEMVGREEVDRERQGEAEALALMQRQDLAADLVLSGDELVIQIARAHGIPVRGFADFVAETKGEAAAASLRGRATSRQEAPTGEESEPMEELADLPRTVEVDEETALLLLTLVERGVGQDASEVVRRAIRGLAAALAN